MDEATHELDRTRQWVKMWKTETGPVLEEIHDRELLGMSEEGARRISAVLLDVPRGNALRKDSGLVEQQFWFQKAWKK
ncbi:MAG TPA: hypothetical protein VK530_19875 [Candidatus Acidoferrum sp.]|nr:hypothetical protein [Candidatus Acidoferrum sp.]